jgi:acyl-CoA reductase-like NAD-dependent aldehyde dehydrogenase
LLEADIDYLVFTGGDAAGRAIARRLGERLIPSTLELSGCDALFVLDDADVELAAQAAWFGATLNRGQTCLAVRRAFVHRSIYSAFCEKITTQAAAAPALRLALPSQVTQAKDLVADAVAAGARRYPPAGPTHTDDHLFMPTALFDATPEMAVCRDAAFAPLFAVIPYDDLEQAIAWDRQCPFALGASVFTSNARRVEELARHLRAGAVTVNDVIAPTAHPATPFGGRGSSGWGITQGAEGLLELTVPQVISRRGGRFRPHYDLAAGRSAVGQDRLLRGLLQASHSPTWSGKLSGWLNVFRNLKPSPVPSTADHSGTNSKPSTTVL